MPTAESSTPPQSSPGGVVSSRVSGTKARMPANTASPTGTLSQNAQRHETSVVSHPPTSGPTAAIPPMVEPQTANAIARSRPANTAFNVDSVAGRIMAAPTPWTSRAPISTLADPAAPATTLATTKTAIPTAKSRRRP